MFLWCAYNQKIRPVEYSSDVLESHDGEEEWVQIGYKNSYVGSAIYVLVILQHLEFQVLMLLYSIAFCEWCGLILHADQA